jgi:uroporphyrinogen decarboxylase
LHRILEVGADAVIAYLSAPRAAGAQALQIFDTWGGVLAPHLYREFSLPYLARIAAELERGRGSEATPLILFGKGNAPYLEELAATGAEGIGVDWTVSLEEARRRTGGRVALQGNLDPVALYATPAALRAEVARVQASYAAGGDGSNTGHVFNLGHGMSPDMDPEQVRVLVEAVHGAALTEPA